MRFYSLVALLSLCLHASAQGQPSVTRPPATRPAATRPIAEATIGELIDQLAEITNDEFALRTNIIAVGADGRGKLPDGLLMLQDRQPRAADAMRELVRRGAAAVPELAARLDDARKTKASVKAMFGGFTYSVEYDWNPRTAQAPPAPALRGANNVANVKIEADHDADRYVLSIGDLCFELIGDIVNRDFNPIRYQPTAVVVINSPVLCPDLRDAVRKEWGRLTPHRHRELLVTDVSRPDWPGRAEAGVAALWRYYPEVVPEAVRKRLELPHYDGWEVRALVDQQLVHAVDGEKRRRLIEDFIRKNGPAYRDGLVLNLWDDRHRRVGTTTRYPDAGPLIEVAPADILREIAPAISLDHHPLVNAVSFYDTADFIEAMGGIESPRIDDLVLAAFRRHATGQSENWVNGDVICEKAITRLAHKGNDDEFLAFCNRRAAQVREEHSVRRLRKLIEFLIAPSKDKRP